jgi:hypothetical protein
LTELIINQASSLLGLAGVAPDTAAAASIARKMSFHLNF